jgi:deoxyribonuclease-1-like protein
MCSWNIQNFGKSKTDSDIVFIASTLRDFDMVALMEVVAGNGGAQAVARLADQLNRTGSKWDYVLSDPTSSYSGGTERYAFLWKPSKIKKSSSWLDSNFSRQIEREPFLCSFTTEEKEFTIALMHAVPKTKRPEQEIKYLKYFPEKYPRHNLIFAGDFNCPQKHSVFIPIKKGGWVPVLVGQKTTLKMECGTGNCLASEYDNIFYDAKKVKEKKAGVVRFDTCFMNIKTARHISDHLPVFFEFELR